MRNIIKELVVNIINPQSKKSNTLDVKQDLQIKFEKSIYLKDYLKTKAWLEYRRPKIYSEIESGMWRLLNEGSAMNEVQLKSILAYMKSIIDELDSMRYAITTGEDAGIKLERMKS